MEQRDWYSLDDLARLLVRDARDVERSANRGRIPGRKRNGVWQFHPTQIRHWLEQEMRGYNDAELAVVEESHRSTELDEQRPVSSLLSVETVQVPLEARTRRSVLECLVEVAGRTWHIWEPATVLQAVLDREAVMSTGYENGVAIPHPRNPLPDVLGDSVVAFGRTASGLPFGAPGRQLTDLYFLVVCRDSKTHLQVLARLGRLLQIDGFLDALREAPDSASAFGVIDEADQQIGGER